MFDKDLLVLQVEDRVQKMSKQTLQVLRISTKFNNFPYNSWQRPIKKRAKNQLEKLFVLVIPEIFLLLLLFQNYKNSQ